MTKEEIIAALALLTERFDRLEWDCEWNHPHSNSRSKLEQILRRHPEMMTDEVKKQLFLIATASGDHELPLRLAMTNGWYLQKGKQPITIDLLLGECFGLLLTKSKSKESV